MLFSEHIGLKVSVQTYKEIEEKAKKMGCGISTLLRMMIKRYLDHM